MEMLLQFPLSKISCTGLFSYQLFEATADLILPGGASMAVSLKIDLIHPAITVLVAGLITPLIEINKLGILPPSMRLLEDVTSNFLYDRLDKL